VERPIGRGRQSSLGDLPPRVVAEVLLGLQQHCRIDGVRPEEGDSCAVVEDVRRQQVRCLADYVVSEAASLAVKGVANSLTSHARQALASTETKVRADTWDLAVFEQPGTVSFASLSQPGLREAAKRWAAEDLPRRRERAGRRTSAGLSVRHHVRRVGPVVGVAVDAPGPRSGPPPRWAALTWRRSCTGWRSRSPPASSAPTPGSVPSVRSAPS